MRAVIPCVALLIACGTGSTGFDDDRTPTPEERAATERELLLEVAGTGGCLEAPDGTVLCSNAPAGGLLGGLIGDPLGTLDCQPTTAPDGSITCALDVFVLTEGLEPGTRLLGAVRPDDLSLPWRSATDLFADVDGDRAIARFETGIAPGTGVLLVALLYPDGVAPPPVAPPGLDAGLLEEYGAPQIAVRADVTVGPLPEP